MIVILLMITGCGKEEYDFSCKKVDTNESYKLTHTVQFGIDNDKVYKLTSTINEEHTKEETANDSYTKYQSLYDNYNENNIISEYKKSEKNITAIYYLDKADIDNPKVELPYDFKLTKTKFIEDLKTKGYKCEEK